jgi:membrane-associated protease RseP (regulator of RpoE activity)
VGRRDRIWLHCLLFAITLLTTSMVGAAMQADFDRNIPFDIESSLRVYGSLWRHPATILQGLPFSLTLMMILLAHEFGHYLAAMFHSVDASLPYFMPSPVLGTFGAFIRVRSPIFSKRVLFDIGIAGPLAGFVFLLPALSVGLAFSKVIPGIERQSSMHFGVPLLQWLLSRAIFPGVRTMDLYLHPMARAAWVGMFATSLNLLPGGQLDGGHIVYAFLPRWHRTISRVLCVLLLPLGKFWYGWIMWSLLLLWLTRHQGHPVIDDPTDLTRGRSQLGWLALLVFLLCFTYEPISAGGL